jgi:hypothetical protein
VAIPKCSPVAIPKCSPEGTDVADQDGACTLSSPGGPDSSLPSVTLLFSQDFSQFSTRHKPNDVTNKDDRKSFENNDVTDLTDKKQGRRKNIHSCPTRCLGLPRPGSGACSAAREPGIGLGIGSAPCWHRACADPPVKVPELRPNSPDEYSAPRPARVHASNGDERSLSFDRSNGSAI